MDTEKIHKILRHHRLEKFQGQLDQAIDDLKKAQESLKRASSAYGAELLEMIKKERY